MQSSIKYLLLLALLFAVGVATAQTHAPGSYRYGFNGMEKDDEVSGKDNSYTTPFRQYDPRLGRWLTIDPLAKKFPWQSPYVGHDNNPIYFVDPTGEATETHVVNGQTGESKYIDDGSDDIVVMNDTKSFNEAVKLGSIYESLKGQNNWFKPKWVAGIFEEKLAEGIRHTLTDFDTGDKNANQHITSLDPRVRTPMMLTVIQGRIEGLDIRGAWLGGHRTYAEQDYLYAIGRTRQKHKKPVTYARGGQSNHNFGVAMDVAIYEDGIYLENGSEWQYKRYGEIAESNGLEWGGRWTKPFDPAHIEYKHGYTMSELRKLPKDEKGHIKAPIKKTP